MRVALPGGLASCAKKPFALPWKQPQKSWRSPFVSCEAMSAAVAMGVRSTCGCDPDFNHVARWRPSRLSALSKSKERTESLAMRRPLTDGSSSARAWAWGETASTARWAPAAAARLSRFMYRARDQETYLAARADIPGVFACGGGPSSGTDGCRQRINGRPARVPRPVDGWRPHASTHAPGSCRRRRRPSRSP